jgi:inosine-uridine nucleoside N-ribohydrolase
MDPGIDDALALEYLLALGSWDLEAITVVAGNVPLKRTWANARGLAALLGVENDVPVYAGCAKPLLRPLHTAEWVHREDGMGGCALPEPAVPPRTEHAVGIIDELSRRHEGKLTIVALGPLTNIAAALILDPPLARRVRQLVFMGGAVRTAGNVTPAAEFNIFADPEAAQVVVQSGIEYTMVGLDATERTLFMRDQMPSLLGDGAVMGFTRELMGFYLDVYEERRGWHGCALHDPLAAAAAGNPTWVRAETGYLLVETRSELTLGQTVFVPQEQLAEKAGYLGVNPGSPPPLGRVAVAPGKDGFSEHFAGVIGDGYRRKARKEELSK